MDKKTYNIQNELLITSYYLNNFNSISLFEYEYFQDEKLKGLVKTVQLIKENADISSFDLDLLGIEIEKTKELDITYKELKEIKESYSDFNNIDYYLSILKSDYQKQIVSKKLLQTLIGKVNSAGVIKTEDILQDLRDIEKSLSIDEEEIFYSGKELADRYIETLKRRIDKDKYGKSIGFKALDKKLTRPAAAKEITIIAALRGVGKSIFRQNLENNLINKGIPVLTFSLEMSEESTMDRFISMKTNINMLDLNKTPEQVIISPKVKLECDNLRKRDNYLFTDRADFSFAKIDKAIYKAKNYFREKGLFKDEEEYMVITIDVLNMVSDFGDQEPARILKAMDALHNLVKKHGVHCIGIVQINESKLRGSKIWKEPDDLDVYRPNLEDIYGGSGYAQRARVVGILHRPRFLKERFFPDMGHIWEVEPDILQFHCAKQNDGELFLQEFIFDSERMRVIPYEREHGE